MHYQDKALPIRSHAELMAAKAAGALVQFTACGNPYDAPAEGFGSGGWIEYSSGWAYNPSEWPMLDGYKFRAFYPVDVEVEDTRFGIGLSTALLLGLGAVAAAVAWGVLLITAVLA